MVSAVLDLDISRRVCCGTLGILTYVCETYHPLTPTHNGQTALWGALADRIQNRRIPMLFGLILLAGSTVLLCLSSTIAMLLAGRILQGLSAALTWTVGLALVIDTVDPRHVGKATGWVGMAMSLGVFVAPLLGGLVYDTGGYYSVFAMCFGLIAVDVALRVVIVEVKDAKRWLDIEVEPARQEEGRTSGPVTGASNSNSNTGITESKQPNAPGRPDHRPAAAQAPHGLGLAPLLGLLRKPRLLAALWGTLAYAIIQTSFDSTLPLFVADTFGWGSVGAGLIFLPVVLPSFLSPLVGALGDRHGPKWLAACGFLLATPCLVCLRFVTEDSTGHKVMLCGLLAGTGVAIALVFGPLMAEITWSVQEDEESTTTPPLGLAYGLYNMAYSAGALLGPIMGGLIRDSAGWGTVGWALGLVAAVTSVTQALWVGGPLTVRRRRQ